MHQVLGLKTYDPWPTGELAVKPVNHDPTLETIDSMVLKQHVASIIMAIAWADGT